MNEAKHPTFQMAIDRLQPSQLYINSDKFEEVKRNLAASNIADIAPIPIKKIDDEIIITDGHTRVLIAYLAGLKYISVCWDEDELDWQAYSICVEWCKQVGIKNIADLENRIVEPEAYKTLWLDRCKAIHKNLK